MNHIFKYLRGDKNIWVITILLGILSIVSVFSFIPILVKVKGLSYSYLFFKHFILLFLGFVIMFFVHKIPVSYFSKLSKLLFYIAILLLVLTIFVGESINGADRWLKIPFTPFSFQTSDFAKLALIIYLSKQLVKREKDFGNFKIVFKHILLPIIITIFFILPANFSTAMLIGILSFTVLFLGNFPWKWMFLTLGGCIVGFGLLLLIAKGVPEVLPRVDTWIKRIERMFDDNVDVQEEMQINNSLLAIKTGGIVGKGPGNGELKRYIPEAYADFYFAAIVEEGGLFIAITLIGLYMILFFRIIKIGVNAKDKFTSLLVIGIGVSTMLPAIVNMMVCTKLIPITGQNMPLLSMGGTSAWFTCIAFGIVLSASRENEKSKKNASTSDEWEGELKTATN